MKFTRDDIFVGMKYINTSDRIVEIVEFDTHHVTHFSKEWKQSYPMSMEAFISRICANVYKLTPDTLKRIKNKEIEYEIY